MDFSLTGDAFVRTLLVATAVVFVLAVLLPLRIRRAPWKYLAQVIGLVLVSVLVLASVGALMNQENNWYTSWDEILSSAEGRQPDVTTASYGAPDTALASSETAATALPHQTATALQRNPRANPVLGGKIRDTAGGQYLTFDYTGQKSGERNQVMVWLPASYLDHPDRFYPVILGITGFPGSPATYQKTIGIGARVEQAVAEHRMREAIVVVPHVMPGNDDSECVDGDRAQPGQRTPKAETYVVDDLVPWLKTNLRTVDSAAGWATEGYSAGGWCASMLSMRHPDLFQSSMSQAGYFAPIYTKGQVWAEPTDRRYDLGRLAVTRAPKVNMYYWTSTADALSWDSGRTFRNAVKAPTSLVVETIPAGGHRIDVWLPGIDRGLAWLGRTSPAFAPTA